MATLYSVSDEITGETPSSVITGEEILSIAEGKFLMRRDSDVVFEGASKIDDLFKDQIILSDLNFVKIKIEEIYNILYYNKMISDLENFSKIVDLDNIHPRRCLLFSIKYFIENIGRYCGNEASLADLVDYSNDVYGAYWNMLEYLPGLILYLCINDIPDPESAACFYIAKIFMRLTDRLAEVIKGPTYDLSHLDGDIYEKILYKKALAEIEIARRYIGICGEEGDEVSKKYEGNLSHFDHREYEYLFKIKKQSICNRAIFNFPSSSSSNV